MPEVSLADPFYLSGYVAIAAALLMTTLMSTGERHRVDFDAVIDSVTVVVVSVLVFWNLSVAEILTDDTVLRIRPLRAGLLPRPRRRDARPGSPGADDAAHPQGARRPVRARRLVLADRPRRLPAVRRRVRHVLHGDPGRHLAGRIGPAGDRDVPPTGPARPRGAVRARGAAAPADARARGAAAARPARAAVVQRPRRRGADPRCRGRRRHDGAGPAHLRAHGAAAAPGGRGPRRALHRPRRRPRGISGEVGVPRHHEPRDPDPDERRHRADRAAAGAPTSTPASASTPTASAAPATRC